MGAKRKPERRADVLDGMADYLLGHGLEAATLRPAASAASTSPRMLLYHFGSKEDLLVAALKEVRRREIDLLAAAMARLPARSPDEVLRSLWRWYAAPGRAPYLELFFEAWGASLRRPALRKGFLAAVRKDMLPVVEQVLVARGYPERDARAVATFVVAAFRGLLLDLVASRDRRRLDDAMEIFALVMRTMEAKGPRAARRVLPQARPSRAQPGARRPRSPASPARPRSQRRKRPGAPV